MPTAFKARPHLFQRLHSRTEYSSIGMDPVVYKKIVKRHSGHIQGGAGTDQEADDL
jgi:light-regulated signal transduction histidine kinase (bacteriophytochrome)